MRNKVIVYELVDTNEEIILTGTIEDIRTFIKNTWKTNKDFIIDITGVKVEEDFYAHVDDTKNLFQVISYMGYQATSVCVVPIEDFMN